jgi:hypothetical protein
VKAMVSQSSPDAGCAAAMPRRTISADDFVASPIVCETGHARSLDDTEAWLRPLIRQVPITRIVNVTPLDFLELPSWSAITPLAKDLTTHAGKGLSHHAARLSAIMEAIERVCAERRARGARGASCVVCGTPQRIGNRRLGSGRLPFAVSQYLLPG